MAKHAVNDEDKMDVAHAEGPEDPMQALESLDVAGPRVE